MATVAMPSAEIVFDTLFAYQRSAALKSALDLDLFSLIDDSATSTQALATRCTASERGIRILCDYLTTLGLLSKSDGTYSLTAESAAFLSKRSPAYLGTTARFLLLPELKQNMDGLTDAVRLGGVAPSGDNKRKYLRHKVPFPIEIRDPDGVGSHMRTKAADISGRGCYVETMLPLPVGKVLSISLWLDAQKVDTPAVVRSCDGGVGMGIEFTGLDEVTQERLQQQIEAMAAEGETSGNANGAG